MTFAGLSNPQDRANVIAFLNKHSDAPEAASGGSGRGRSAAKPGDAAAGNGLTTAASGQGTAPRRPADAADSRRRRRER